MINIGRNVTGVTLALFGIGSFFTLAFGLIFLKLSPLVVGGLLVGGTIVTVSTLRPYLGVHVMLALMFFEGGVRISEDLTLTKAVGGLITLGWLVNALMQRRLRHALNLPTILVSLYLAWCVLAVTHALDPSLAMNQFLTYVLLAVSMIMIGAVVDTPQRLYHLLFAVAFWAIVSSLIALLMYYGGRTPIAVGVTGNRNLLAGYINVGVIAALLTSRLIQGVVPRLVLLLGVPVLLLTLALTLSRTGLIVLGITMLTVWYRLARERGFLVLLGSTLTCLALVLLLPGQFWQRAGTILPSIERQQDTFGTRVRLWVTGLRMVQENPLLGVGPGNFVLASARYGTGGASVYRLSSHSMYVGTAAETGLVGLALLMGVFFSALVGARRVATAARHAGRRDLALAGVTTETMIIAVMLSGLTGTTQGSKVTWIGLGMCVAFVAIGRKSLAADARAVESAVVPVPGASEVGAT